MKITINNNVKDFDNLETYRFLQAINSTIHKHMKGEGIYVDVFVGGDEGGDVTINIVEREE